MCAGNPLIAQKMNLDIDVARLHMLKADYQSPKYRLEDDLLENFPKQIASVKEHISGLENDIKLYEKHKENTIDIQQTVGGSASVSAKFAGMTIGNNTYSEKEPAAKALLEACKTLGESNNPSIGDYMGFEMSLRFDSFSKNFMLSLKGSITHNVELGTDAFGNITRINNVLASMPEKLASANDNLNRIYQQQQAAKDELEKPFALADELSEKELKLAEINTQLDIEGVDEIAEESADVPITDITDNLANYEDEIAV